MNRYTIKCVEQMYKVLLLVFFELQYLPCSVPFSPPSLCAKVFTEKLFPLVSFIFSVPRAKNFVKNVNTANKSQQDSLAQLLQW